MFTFDFDEEFSEFTDSSDFENWLEFNLGQIEIDIREAHEEFENHRLAGFNKTYRQARDTDRKRLIAMDPDDLGRWQQNRQKTAISLTEKHNNAIPTQDEWTESISLLIDQLKAYEEFLNEKWSKKEMSRMDYREHIYRVAMLDLDGTACEWQEGQGGHKAFDFREQLRGNRRHLSNSFPEWKKELDTTLGPDVKLPWDGDIAPEELRRDFEKEIEPAPPGMVKVAFGPQDKPEIWNNIVNALSEQESAILQFLKLKHIKQHVVARILAPAEAMMRECDDVFGSGRHVMRGTIADHLKRAVETAKRQVEKELPHLKNEFREYLRQAQGPERGPNFDF